MKVCGHKCDARQTCQMPPGHNGVHDDGCSGGPVETRCSCGALVVLCKGELHDCAVERGVALQKRQTEALERIAAALDRAHPHDSAMRKVSSEEWARLPPHERARSYVE